MTRAKTTLVGNWKMNGDAAMARALVEAVATAAAPGVEIVLCPPATLLCEVQRALSGFDIRLGGQDCHSEKSGAFTGDISAPMLKEAGCAYVIVGHSERRRTHGETNEMVCAKATAAIGAGLIPIICIGETESQRKAGNAEEAVRKQLRESVPTNHQPPATNHFILAYEPVWAIGSGQTPSVDDIKRMHAAIRAEIAGARVLYGGSVNAANAREILTIEGVSGVLVGGASVKAEEFVSILRAA